MIFNFCIFGKSQNSPLHGQLRAKEGPYFLADFPQNIHRSQKPKNRKKISKKWSGRLYCFFTYPRTAKKRTLLNRTLTLGNHDSTLISKKPPLHALSCRFSFPDQLRQLVVALAGALEKLLSGSKTRFPDPRGPWGSTFFFNSGPGFLIKYWEFVEAPRRLLCSNRALRSTSVPVSRTFTKFVGNISTVTSASCHSVISRSDFRFSKQNAE